MSRRSSKTAHVLGLITAGNKENDEITKTKEEVESAQLRGSETQASTPEEAPEVRASENVSGNSAPIQSDSITYSADISENPIQKDTRETEDNKENESPLFSPENTNLKRIITGDSKMQGSSRKAPIVEILFNDHDPLSDVIRDQLEAGEAMAEATRREIKMSEEKKRNEGDLNAEQTSDVVVTKGPSNNHTYIKDKLTNESKELSYKFLNVYEELVRERVLDAIDTMEACTCDRCIVDTIALAVTNLPSKCIVADKDAVFPLLSYYRSKFSTAVQTELMKAAMIVKENPHHDKEVQE